MSGGTRDAQRVFDAGVLSLGIPIDGLETEPDVQYAALAFKRATEYDPDMCDAWLGRAAAGESTPEVIHHLHRRARTWVVNSGGSVCRRARSADGSRRGSTWTTR